MRRCPTAATSLTLGKGSARADAAQPVAASRRRFGADDLLDAALRCFAEHGYDGTSMSGLAEAAGTTKPTLYERLGGKEDIYRRVVEREAAQVQRALETAYEDAAALSGGEAVALATRPLFDLARQHPDGFRILYGSIPGAPAGPRGDRVLDDIAASVARLLQRWVAAHGHDLRAGDARLLAAMCVGVVRNAVLHAASAPDVDFDAAQRRAEDFLVAALFNLAPPAER